VADPSTLALFAATAYVFLIVPGPAVIFGTTRSIDQGRAAGMATVLGIHTGTVVHTVAAALGVSAMLVSSAAAFAVVKLPGAASWWPWGSPPRPRDRGRPSRTFGGQWARRDHPRVPGRGPTGEAG
jgi:LysE type translocator